MRIFRYYIGPDENNSKSLEDLRNDLENIIRKSKLREKLIPSTNDLSIVESTYISSKEGEYALNIWLSDQRVVKVMKIGESSEPIIKRNCNGIVSVDGFNKDNEIYRNLTNDLEKLKEIYHKERKTDYI